MISWWPRLKFQGRWCQLSNWVDGGAFEEISKRNQSFSYYARFSSHYSHPMALDSLSSVTDVSSKLSHSLKMSSVFSPTAGSNLIEGLGLP